MYFPAGAKKQLTVMIQKDQLVQRRLVFESDNRRKSHNKKQAKVAGSGSEYSSDEAL